jgi:MFS transporter, FHS family, glucose/mannose:H+ symporter
MATSATPRTLSSAKALTFAAHSAFVPIGIVTVLLSPLLPTLSARWSLNYSQAGELFTAQFLASTGAVLLSGVLISRWGFRFAMKAGLLVIAVSVAGLLSGSRLMGMACIAGYGIGIGLAVPAANLVVSEVNPARRSAALNLLNFSWSAGAVACPFLVAAAAKGHHITTFLILVAALTFFVAVGIALMPSSIFEPSVPKTAAAGAGTDWKHRSFLAMAALFFLYVGTENSFGGWVASYASSLGSCAESRKFASLRFVCCLPARAWRAWWVRAQCRVSSQVPASRGLDFPRCIRSQFHFCRGSLGRRLRASAPGCLPAPTWVARFFPGS